MDLKKIWDEYIEIPLFDAGLLQNRPLRFVVFSSASFLMLYYFKPVGLFDNKGKIRPNSILSDSKNSTPIDIFTLSFFVGVLSLLFI